MGVQVPQTNSTPSFVLVTATLVTPLSKWESKRPLLRRWWLKPPSPVPSGLAQGADGSPPHRRFLVESSSPPCGSSNTSPCFAFGARDVRLGSVKILRVLRPRCEGIRGAMGLRPRPCTKRVRPPPAPPFSMAMQGRECLALRTTVMHNAIITPPSPPPFPPVGRYKTEAKERIEERARLAPRNKVNETRKRHTGG